MKMMKMIQIAFAKPPMSRRRKMSAKHAIAIQIHMIRAVKMSMSQRMFRNG